VARYGLNARVKGKPFTPSPQNRQQGSGEGRKNFMWKFRCVVGPVIADSLLHRERGGTDALEKDREWGSRDMKRWIWEEFGRLFPGIHAYLRDLEPDKTEEDWQDSLFNRAYKMYWTETKEAKARGIPDLSRGQRGKEHWSNYLPPNCLVARLGDLAAQSRLRPVMDWNRPELLKPKPAALCIPASVLGYRT